MAVRGTQQLGVEVDPAGTPITYSSANDSVATVSSTGLITGMGDGNTIVTVSAGDKTAQVSVHVQIDI